MGRMREGNDSGIVTVRQEVADYIKNNPSSAKAISQAIGQPEKNVYNHLEHIAKSYGKDFRVILPECRKCGFIFSKKIGKPSKCPECQGTWISDPEYYIK